MKMMRCIFTCLFLTAPSVFAAEVVRIDSIEPLEPQPHKTNESVIWYDSFDKPSKQYFEQKGDLTPKQALGGKGRSLEVFYPKGKGGSGSANRKLAIGDTPVGSGKAVRKGEKFDTVYWRMYVKHQKGWIGNGPAKMSRVMIFNAGDWSQAMISHVWGSGPNLTLDPVRAARGDKATTSRYNDWGGLTWLGNSPGSQFKIHATEESGRWVCVEALAKLNTPGKSDGYNCLWIDGIRQCERRNLDFRSQYTKYGVNAVFMESYWNKGSPVDQYRWYDDLVVSTGYIGPVYTPLNPVLLRTSGSGSWMVEIAARDDKGPVAINRSENTGKGRNPVIGENINGELVWRSKLLSGSKTEVNNTNGRFMGSRKGRNRLEQKKLHFCRSRAENGEWSTWHQAFQTGVAK